MQLTIKLESDRFYLVSWQSRIIARYETLKTKPVARLKAVYLGVAAMPEAQTIAKTVSKLFGCRVEIRPGQRTTAAFEVVIRSPKVGQMAAIEKFILALITAAEMPPAAPKAAHQITVKPIAPIVNRPDQPDRALVRSGNRVLNIA